MLLGEPGGVRDVNASLLLDLVLRYGPLSRTELLERSRLSKATVSVITGDLVARGLVRETGTVRSSRGPRRIQLEFNPEVAAVIGVQVSDDNLVFVRTDLFGRVAERWLIDREVQTPADLVDAVATGLSRPEAQSEVPLLGVGLGVPGLVDPECRRVLVALSHDWHQVDLADQLEARLTRPVAIVNRAKVVALGQAGAGLSSVGGARNVLSLYLGNGVVAGSVVDGRLCFGSDGTAGDLGHLTVDPAGAACECGRRGCLQTVVARRAVLADARRQARRARDAVDVSVWADVVAAARRREPYAIRIAERVGRQLGEVVAPLAAALCPEVIALAGPTADLGPSLVTAVHGTIRSLARTEADIPVVRVDADAAPRGAAMLFLQQRTALGLPEA